MAVNLHSTSFLILNSEGRTAGIFDDISVLPAFFCSVPLPSVYLKNILLVVVQSDKGLAFPAPCPTNSHL